MASEREALKIRARMRLAEARAEKANRRLSPPPRYDAEFFEGVRWLDSLADEETESENRHGK